MAASSGSQTTSVAERLANEPQRFGFFQAVRLLRKMRPGAPPPGEGDEPRDEPVRFGSGVSLSFPPSDVAELIPGEGDAPPHLATPFFGIASPASYGSLPTAYTEYVRDEARRKNTAPRDFLDVFNHRLIALFYRAWEKHRFAIAYEGSSTEDGDRFESNLYAILGLGDASLRHRLPLRDLALLRWAGPLARGRVTAEALEKILEGYFEVPVAIEEFVLRRHILEEGELSPLGAGRDRLGRGAFLGRTLTTSQFHVRVKLGPLDRRDYIRFLPTGDAYAPFRELMRFATGSELDFDVRLVLRAKDVPPLRLGARAPGEAPRLGWLAWIGTRARDRDASDVTIPESTRPRAAA